MSADRRPFMRGTLYGAPHATLASSTGGGLERGLGGRRGPVEGTMFAEPAHGRGDAVLHLDPRLPAEQLAGLLDRGPTAADVDGEGGPVGELEGVRVLAAGLPDYAGDLGDGQLA